MSKVWVGKARLALASMLMLVGLVAAACESAGATVDAIDLVPADSEMVARVDLAAILNDTDVQQAYENAAAGEPDVPPTLEALLAKVQAEIGFDISTFEELTFFGTIDDSGNDGSGGLLVSGSAAREEFLDLLVAAEPNVFTKGEYGGRTLLTISGESDVIAVLGGVVVVAEAAVAHKVIDVYNGDADKLSGDLLDYYEGLGSPWVKAAVDIPAGLADEAAGEAAMIGFSMDALLSLERLGVVVDKDGKIGTLSVRAVYPTVEDAEEVVKTLEALITLMTGFAPDPQLTEIADLLSISADGEEVVIEISQDVDELIELATSLGSGDAPIPF